MNTWCAIALISPALLLQQRPTGPAQAQGTIKLEVPLVPVDVIVTDQNGNPVLDLAKGDFLVRENGVIQEISHFSLVRFDRDALALPATSDVPKEFTGYRTFLIVLGRGRHDQSFQAVSKLISFVKEGLHPSDRVAVMAYNRSTEFTTNHDKIATVLEQYRDETPWIEAILEQSLRGLAAVYGSRKIPDSVQPRIDAIFRGPVLRSRVSPLPGQSGEPRTREREGLEIASRQQMAEEAKLAGINPTEMTAFDEARLSLLTDLPFDEYTEKRASTHQDLMNLYSAIEYLRFARGEKHLLFFTAGGLYLPRLEDDRSLASVAADARVRIYPIETGGATLQIEDRPSRDAFQRLRSLPAVQGSFSDSFALDSIRNVASLTGGEAFIGKDTTGALARVARTTGAVYLLAYRPNAKFDGKYRKIEVSVARPGLKVSTRGGYYARSRLMHYDHEQFRIYARTVAAASYGEPIADLPFSFEVANVSPEEKKTSLDLILTFRPSKEMFSRADERYACRLAISCFFLTEKGELVWQRWDVVEWKLPEQTLLHVLQKGFPVTNRLEIPTRIQKGWLKIVLYSPTSDQLGSRAGKF